MFIISLSGMTWEKKFIDLGKQGSSYAKLVVLGLQIRSALLKRNGEKEKPNCNESLPVPSASPHPNPKTTAPKLGALKKSVSEGNKGSQPPNSPKMTESPHPRSLGQTAWDPSQPPVSQPPDPQVCVRFAENADCNLVSQPQNTENRSSHMALLCLPPPLRDNFAIQKSLLSSHSSPAW